MNRFDWNSVMAQERNLAIGVMQIAAANGAKGICTFRRAYAEIPSHVNLSKNNTRMSDTRPREPMWHQLVRNIKSHDETHKNFIANGLLVHIPHVGYQITQKGRQYLKKHNL